VGRAGLKPTVMATSVTSTTPRPPGVSGIADLGDTVGHPGGADHSVALGPGADVPAQHDRVALGVHGDIAVVGYKRVTVQGVLHQQGQSTGSTS
jgi:hypothetical protein